MTDWNDTDSIAYCGLICAGCAGLRDGCTGCRDGGGDDGCPIRDCCQGKGLQGCWECDGFPCERGAFGSAEWSGLSTALVQAAQKKDLQAHLDQVHRRLGQMIDYGAFRGLSADEVFALLDKE